MPAPETSLDTLDTRILQRAVTDLAKKYEGIFSAETVERYVYESYATLSRTARIRKYLPVLAERFAKDRLRALAISEGKIDTVIPQVLFVCVHNSGRSQIAAALLSDLAGPDVEVRSAGSLPGSEIHPLVIEELKSRNIDLAGAFPKPLTDDVVRAADYVITMGCGDACPIYPGKTYLDWDLPDPTDQTREEVSDIVDQVDVLVNNLWKEIEAKN
ncbi:three-helix bundle dimerization domain-containing protein [Corynebacterium lubricantis]|uniref:arsenate reductase/protein-tyrosine-phosphatase family protein n=1 Tax=Corynebacterium lubricantis TaxID=541095 RepID=UPI00037C77F0|nr:hypothetical protein [Corynebacterium lubricantis]